jgi:hypothetical protein
MAVYRAPDTRSYQRPFRIFSLSAIAALVSILLFSIYEPQGVSRSTNVALAFLMGAIVLGVIGYGLSLSFKEAMWKVKQALQWELTDDKLVQSHKDGATVEIPLNEVRSLHEYQGWLLVSGGEPLKGIKVPSDLNGYEQIKRELASHCALTPLKVKVSLFSYLLPIVLLLLFLLFLSSHVPMVIVIAGTTLLVFYPVLAAYSLRRVWRTKSIPKLVLSSHILAWLTIAWLFLQRVRSVK